MKSPVLGIKNIYNLVGSRCLKTTVYLFVKRFTNGLQGFFNP